MTFRQELRALESHITVRGLIDDPFLINWSSVSGEKMCLLFLASDKPGGCQPGRPRYAVFAEHGRASQPAGFGRWLSRGQLRREEKKTEF